MGQRDKNSVRINQRSLPAGVQWFTLKASVTTPSSAAGSVLPAASLQMACQPFTRSRCLQLCHIARGSSYPSFHWLSTTSDSTFIAMATVQHHPVEPSAQLWILMPLLTTSTAVASCHFDHNPFPRWQSVARWVLACRQWPAERLRLLQLGRDCRLQQFCGGRAIRRAGAAGLLLVGGHLRSSF